MARCVTFIRSARSSLPLHYNTGSLSTTICVALHKNKKKNEASPYNRVSQVFAVPNCLDVYSPFLTGLIKSSGAGSQKK